MNQQETDHEHQERIALLEKGDVLGYYSLVRAQGDQAYTRYLDEKLAQINKLCLTPMTLSERQERINRHEARNRMAAAEKALLTPLQAVPCGSQNYQSKPVCSFCFSGIRTNAATGFECKASSMSPEEAIHIGQAAHLLVRAIRLLAGRLATSALQLLRCLFP